MLIHPMAERRRRLGLTAMADGLLELLNQSAAADLSREDWLGLLIDREVTARQQAARPTAERRPVTAERRRRGR